MRVAEWGFRPGVWRKRTLPALSLGLISRPNPWPKKPQLARRWHGHAIFPTIVALAGAIECRSNWKTYIDEFAAALQQLTDLPVLTESYLPAESALTPFEEKYRASGHALWRCRIELAPQAQTLS
jgi:tRNA G46 methylase TrmB